MDFFVSRQKFKDENNYVMQLLGKILMKSLFGEQTRKDIEEKFACKSENWMMSESDELVEDCWRIPHGNYIVKMVADCGIEDEVEK